ncbi:Protein-lysine N-methyltransferase efm6 [Malassezia obtusa]|uniref:Protein-lysine N-methyltransferase EFM6 n=1 Tax=Malassezia obtusa TaxID=76774 RepID=A0AAF0DZ13_9BASI|nr:Protein-lysine N-methyltransferase efm6 [Malassezia obtusa]
MDAPWLFGRADDSPPPSPDLEPAQGDELIPEQIPSILGQRAVITYFCDGARAPVTTVERQDAPLPPARPDAYAICLTLDMTSGCGGTIWPAAEVLGAYIASMMTRTHTTPDTHPWRGKTIVELGSGTGLIGFLVAQIGCGATTWITDQVPMLPLMDSNTQLNKERMVDACHVAELNWGEPIPHGVPAKPDVLLLADCVYREEAFQPLVDTMVELATPQTEILFSYHKRRRADKRFFAMLKKHFTYTHVEDDDPVRRQAYNREGTSLMRIHRRS